MTHFGVIQDESLTGGFLESVGIIPPDPNLSSFEFIKSDKLVFSPETKSLINTINQLSIANLPSVSTDLFARVRDNISQTFSQFRDVFELQATQLVGLGEAAVGISGALSEQVAIREEQLARTQEQIRNQQLAINAITEGRAGAGFDPIKFFTDNPLIGGIGIGGLAVGGIILLILLRR